MGPHDMLPARGALTNGRRMYRRLLDCEMCEDHAAGKLGGHHGLLPGAAAFAGSLML